MHVAKNGSSVRKRIVERVYFRTSAHPKSAKDSVICRLECGHERRFKGSEEPAGKEVKCLRCTKR